MSFHIKCSIQIKGAPQTSKHAHKGEVIASLSLRLLLLISSLTTLRQSFLLAYHGVLGRWQLAGQKIRLNNAGHHPSKQQDRFILVIHRAIMMKIILFCRHWLFKVRNKWFDTTYSHLVFQDKMISILGISSPQEKTFWQSLQTAQQPKKMRVDSTVLWYQCSLLELPKLFQKSTCIIASLETHWPKVAVINEKKNLIILGTVQLFLICAFSKKKKKMHSDHLQLDKAV